MKDDMEEQMLDLLCKRAVYGLDGHEERQLSEIQKTFGPGYDVESFELAAAAISTANLDPRAELPANLRSRIGAEAERYFDEKEASELATETQPVTPKSKALLPPSWLGWAVAVLAVAVMAINLYFTRPDTERAGTDSPPSAAQISPEQMRQQLIETAPDLERARVAAGNVTGLNPSGDVVWSDARQAGFVRLAGLPVNDTSRETYQLWIFAENQDPKTPVDGGTFNVSSSGEVVIPIDPRVRVRSPKAFAVTIEKPGGVVVSKQERVAALAKPETAGQPAA